MLLQENYFGVDQKFTDYEEVSHEKSSTFTHVSALDGKDRVFDPRHYRPLHIKLNVTLHDIQAHLVKVRTRLACQSSKNSVFQIC